MKKLLQLLCLCLLLSSVSQAQVKLGSFAYSAGPPVVDLAWTANRNLDASYKDANITGMTLSRGNGLIWQNNSTLSYVGIIPNGQDESVAVSNNVYYQVQVNPGSNYSTFSGISARLRTANDSNSATAAVSANITARWYYSLDGNSYTPIGNPVLVGNTVTAGVEQPLVDLSNIDALKTVAPNTSVYFRLYVWGANGGTDSQRGFGFGKSNTSGLEVLSILGYASQYPTLAAWSLNGKNAVVSSVPVANIPTVFQNKQLNVNSGLSEPINIERGDGLNAGSLSNSFAVILKADLLTSSVPSNLAESKSNQSYYSIKFKGASGLYTNILGYKMKFRNGTTGISVSTKYELLIGDNDNNISSQSQVFSIDENPVETTNSTSSGKVYTNTFSFDNVSATIPPDKNAELRIYVYATPTSSSVFGLGQGLLGDRDLEIYGRLLTLAELQVLPVTLTSFKSTKQSNSVRLNWATASEQNNSHFNVLRAGDDKKFTSIAKVNGNGSTNVSKEYTLTDYKPLAGANYYKLSQTDLDGNVHEVGDVQYAYFDLNNTSLTVLYGAETAVLKANLTANKADQATVAVYTVSGNSLYQAQLNINSGVNQVEVPVHFQKGMYILKVITSNGEVWQSKFIR
ncbi:MAG: T9SS type A sorting domain-containing protein [Pedobacter sp.]|nr:MAG: T9SS type A sorting domain-containing protein [Pedobacter sp.]